MATKKKEVSSSWNGFYNYYLSDEEKAGIRIFMDGDKAPRVSDCILELAKNNYKITCSKNDSNDTFICSVTGKQGSLNRGYTYSISHVDLNTAVIAVWFVVSEIHGWGEWPIEKSNVPDW